MDAITSHALSEIARRRTFAIISHPDAGKTTLTEKLIFHGGVIREAGEVKGKAGTKSATSDWMAMEKSRGISITSSVLQFDWAGLRINLLDTPGHKDFSEDTYRTLVAADSAVMLIDVAKGVEERTRKLYEVCRYREVPIFTFINKCDREGKAPLELLDEIESTLGMACWPVTWPVGLGGLFHGIFHRLRREIIIDPTARVFSDRGIDAAALFPNSVCRVESLLDASLEEWIEPQALSSFREDMDLLDGTMGDFSVEDFIAGKVSPATFGSAKNDFGVDVFLDVFKDWAPAPTARPVQVSDGRGASRDGVISPDEPELTGFVFKIQANIDRRHRDRIAFIRICSGKFERGMKVIVPRIDREVRLSFSSQFVANERETVDVAYAGDIIGVGDSGIFRIGDTVTTGPRVEFEQIPQFAPELFARLSVTDAMKRQKLQKGLRDLSEEGAVQLFIDPAIGAQDPIIGVVGELQFEVLLYRLQDEYGLESRLNRLSYGLARWPRSAEGVPVETLNGSPRIYRDRRDQPVILLDKEWDLNWIRKENPNVDFATTIAPVRKSGAALATNLREE